MLLYEKDIRPATSDPACLQKAIEKDRLWLLSKHQFFAHVSCPACRSIEVSSSFSKDGFIFGWCKNCKTLYMPNRPTVTLLDEFYQNSALMNYFANVIFPASQEQRIKNIYNPRSEQVIAYAKAHGCHNYLEVGAGSGSFAKVLEEKQYFDSLTIVEPNIELAGQCQQSGITTINKPIENITPSDVKADIVSCFEVIEHLFSPKDFLTTIAKILPQNGLFIMTTPNGLSPDVLELGSASSTVGMTHLNIFNPHSIITLLESCGFAVVEITTPGQLDHSLLHNYYTTHSPKEKTFLSYLLTDGTKKQIEGFQKYLQQFQLSSHMQVLAKRI